MGYLSFYLGVIIFISSSYKCLIWYISHKNFSPILWVIFTFLMVFFEAQKILISMMSSLSCCSCFWCHTQDSCWFLNCRYYKTKWMNSSLSWKSIVHKAEFSETPWRTRRWKTLMLTAVASSLTKASRSDGLFRVSTFDFLFRTMVECKIEKLWHPKRKKTGNTIFFSYFTCGLFFFHWSLKSLREYFHLSFIWINEWMEQSNHKDICFKKKKKNWPQIW